VKWVTVVHTASLMVLHFGSPILCFSSSSLFLSPYVEVFKLGLQGKY